MAAKRMSRINGRREKTRGNLPPFVPLFWIMLNSPAFKSLPPSAAKALPFFLGKVKLHPRDPEKYQAEFIFSYREGQKRGFALATFSKIIRDLIWYGFIDPVDRGGLRGDCKTNNKFRLSKRWEAYGSEQFKAIEWKNFHPML
jgi:hypothetical protein